MRLTSCCARSWPPSSQARTDPTTHADLQYATVDGQGLLYRQYGAEHAGVPIVLLSRFQGTIDDWDPEVLSRPAGRPVGGNDALRDTSRVLLSTNQ
jgi:hypothetical protein